MPTRPSEICKDLSAEDKRLLAQTYLVYLRVWQELNLAENMQLAASAEEFMDLDYVDFFAELQGEA